MKKERSHNSFAMASYMLSKLRHERNKIKDLEVLLNDANMQFDKSYEYCLDNVKGLTGNNKALIVLHGYGITFEDDRVEIEDFE